MNVTFHCPKCQRDARATVDESAESWNCPQCGAATDVPAGAIVERRLRRCLVCPSGDLFVRKDFPQRLGVAIVTVQFAIYLVASYFYWTKTALGVLFVGALVDVMLYQFVGQALVCYRCGAHYRSLEGLEGHGSFNLETHERYRQQAARQPH
jgi:hypothetical protein